MATLNSAWGIDIGQCALKAIKLKKSADGEVGVEAFEVVEHSGVLSQGDVDTHLVIQTTLDEFLRRVDVSDSVVSVSVLGQSSFTRFVKLPPVEKSKIPDIVRFEAEQQIPFPIEEVTWRYQTFQDEDSPEVEAGIFAMKQVDVAEMLAYFANVALDVDLVQMAPLALYNFLIYDQQVAEGGATMLADVGADKTHLVVADGKRIWTRTLQIGGNNFTEALVKSFKLSFAKAEKLKRTAASSKYARQIFQVMRPVFADLVQEIQRSIGYYTSLNRECRFKKLVGMGNGFRLPGMQKYLEQNLNMSVTRVEKFSEVSSESKDFKDHVLSLGVSYGLALQALDMGIVRTNLLPETILRRRLWGQKKAWFGAAAAAVLLAVGVFAFRSYGDRSVLQSPVQKRELNEAAATVRKLQDWKTQARQITGEVKQEEQQIRDNLKLRAYSRIWPAINDRISEALLRTMATETDIQILQAFGAADAARQEELASQVKSDQVRMELISKLPYRPPSRDGKATLRQRLIAGLGKIPRQKRQIVILEEQTSQYLSDLSATGEDDKSKDAAKAGMATGMMDEEMMGRRSSRRGRRSRKSSPQPVVRKEVSRGFEITLIARTPLSEISANQKLGVLKAELERLLDEDPNLEVVGQITHAWGAEQGVTGGAKKAKRTKPVRGGRAPRRRGGMSDEMGMEMEMMGAMPQGRGRKPRIKTKKSTKAVTTEEDADIIDPRWADPLFEGESMEHDLPFTLTIRVAVTGGGMGAIDEEENESGEASEDRRFRRRR